MGRPRKTDGSEKVRKKREVNQRNYEARKRRKEEGENEEQNEMGRPRDEGGGDAKMKRQEINARYYRKHKDGNVLKVKITGNKANLPSPASILKTSKVCNNDRVLTVIKT